LFLGEQKEPKAEEKKKKKKKKKGKMPRAFDRTINCRLT